MSCSPSAEPIDEDVWEIITSDEEYYTSSDEIIVPRIPKTPSPQLPDNEPELPNDEVVQPGISESMIESNISQSVATSTDVENTNGLSIHELEMAAVLLQMAQYRIQKQTKYRKIIHTMVNHRPITRSQTKAYKVQL